MSLIYLSDNFFYQFVDNFSALILCEINGLEITNEFNFFSFSLHYKILEF